MLDEFQIDEGWDSDQNQIFIQKENNNEEVQRQQFQYQSANSILNSHHHSLQPDMLFGWKPKLPSCPLPLAYPNYYLDNLINYIPSDDRFKVAYIGPNYVNSVQVNQQYSYYWKYRNRYSLNLALVQEAVKNIGKQQIDNLQIIEAEYKFNSAFESGNLQLAIRIKKNQYDCFIRSDTNTKGHTNWYYFSVKNQNNLGPVQINICNIGKNKNLYDRGMKPYVSIDEELDKWTQNYTYDVQFVQRYCRYGFDKKKFQLQFKYDFKNVNQTVYFAYAIPYTYSKLQKFIKEIQQKYPSWVSCKKMCQSLGGINLPLLTITNSGQGEQNCDSNHEETNISRKKALLITGRIHPGESNASHVLQGFIRQLLNDTLQSDLLRKNFVFYVVPMLNPDGVIVGNFRCSYSGKDLNRQFNKLNKYTFPQITHLNQLSLQLKRQYKKEIQFYFDFHGHSRKKGLFCYGPEHPTSKIMFFKCRAFAKIIGEITPIFSYKRSIFTISEHKKTTGRAHMLKKLKIPMTFTFEISNGMYDDENQKNLLLNRTIMINAGSAITKSLFRYIKLEKNTVNNRIKAKIDTGIHKKRPIHSSKTVRGSISVMKNKNFKTPQLQNLNQRKNLCSLKQIGFEDNEELFRLFKEIKKDIKTIEEEAEGGSDSQGSEEDFSAEESNKLFALIQKNNNISQYNSRKNFYDYQKKDKKIEKKKQSATENQKNFKGKKKNLSSKILELPRKSMQMVPKALVRKLTAMQNQKIVVAQKNFTLDL